MKKLIGIILQCSVVLLFVGICVIVLWLNKESYNSTHEITIKSTEEINPIAVEQFNIDKGNESNAELNVSSEGEIKDLLFASNENNEILDSEQLNLESINDSTIIMRNDMRVISKAELSVHPETIYYISELAHITHMSRIANMKVFYEDGSTENLRHSSLGVTFGSSNEDVLIVREAGNHHAVGIGTATIFAEYGGVRTEIEVTVVKGSIERIEVYPEEIVVIHPGKKEGRDVRFVPSVTMAAVSTGGSAVHLAVYGEIVAPHILHITNENPSIIDVSDIFQEQAYIESNDGDILTASFSTSDIPVNSARLAGETNIIVSIGEISALTNDESVEIMSSRTAIIPVTALSADDIIGIQLFIKCINEICHEEGCDEIRCIEDERTGKYMEVCGGSHINVFALFNNGVKVDIKSVASYSIDDPDILDINAVSLGRIYGLNKGYATITAAFAGFTDSETFVVE